MPATYTSLHCHAIFSTKHRLPFISKDWRDRLHAYLGGIVKGLNAVPLAIGGIEDHAHLLVGLRSIHRLDYFLRDLKADSSEWIHRELGIGRFAWQAGYGAVSVCPSEIQQVTQYILNQEEHHRRMTFQEEYVAFLRDNGIEFDDRYLW